MVWSFSVKLGLVLVKFSVTGSREWVWERPLDQGKFGTGHYVIVLMCWLSCRLPVP